MPRMIIALIRHGDYQQPESVPSAHLPYALTEEGCGQAQDTAQSILKLVNEKGWEIFPTIDSSLQLRAWQTASIIATGLKQSNSLDLTIESFAALAERSLGSAANLTVQQIEKIVAEDPRYNPLPADWKSDSLFQLPLQGAESLMFAGERVKNHIDSRVANLVKNLTADTLKIFIGHGAAFRHAAVHMGILTSAEAIRLSMFHCHPIYIELIDRSWKHIDGNWKVRHNKDTCLD